MKKELIKMILIRAGMNDPRGRVSEKAKKKGRIKNCHHACCLVWCGPLRKQCWCGIDVRVRDV